MSILQTTMRSGLTYIAAILSAVGLSHQQLQLRKSYDYVICGGGTAGLTLAARLSELNATVLVVEIGGDAAGAVDWEYSQTIYNTTLSLWTGKGLGGSSSVNGMHNEGRFGTSVLTSSDFSQVKFIFALRNNRLMTGRKPVMPAGIGRTCGLIT